MASPFMVTLDPKHYSTKPGARDAAAITRRMQEAEAVELTPPALREHVANGGAWMGGTYDPRKGGWGEFAGQRIFALDFDNETHDKPKRPLHPGEAGYIGPLDAVRVCLDCDVEPMLLYFTFGARLDPLHCKFRLVIDNGEVASTEQEARAVLDDLLAAFPEADQSCKNPNRLFYGSGGECWPLYDWLNRDGGWRSWVR